MEAGAVEAEAVEAGAVVVVAVGVVFAVEVGDGAVAFSAAGGKVVSAGVAGSTHYLKQFLNSARPRGAFGSETYGAAAGSS